MLPMMATVIMRLKTTVQLTSAASDILQIVTKKKKIRYRISLQEMMRLEADKSLQNSILIRIMIEIRILMK